MHMRPKPSRRDAARIGENMRRSEKLEVLLAAQRALADVDALQGTLRKLDTRTSGIVDHMLQDLDPTSTRSSTQSFAI